jgi:hypothetical protein
MTTLDSIITQIKKLREVVARGATQGEMENAAALIQKLMLKHNIEEAHLSIDAGEPLSGYGHRVLSEKSQRWRIVLMNAVAHGNNCRMIQVKGTEKTKSGGTAHIVKLDVFGHRDAVRVVFDLYAELSQAIEILSDREWARDAVMYMDPSDKRKWRNSWCHGAADTLSRRFARAVLDAKAESTNSSTALTIIDTKVDETIAKVYNNLRKVTNPRYNALDDAYDRGREAAQDMNLNPTRKLR